jgi:hypothetical protein
MSNVSKLLEGMDPRKAAEILLAMSEQSPEAKRETRHDRNDRNERPHRPERQQRPRHQERHAPVESAKAPVTAPETAPTNPVEQPTPVAATPVTAPAVVAVAPAPAIKAPAPAPTAKRRFTPGQILTPEESAELRARERENRASDELEHTRQSIGKEMVGKAGYFFPNYKAITRGIAEAVLGGANRAEVVAAALKNVPPPKTRESKTEKRQPKREEPKGVTHGDVVERLKAVYPERYIPELHKLADSILDHIKAVGIADQVYATLNKDVRVELKKRGIAFEERAPKQRQPREEKVFPEPDSEQLHKFLQGALRFGPEYWPAINDVWDGIYLFLKSRWTALGEDKNKLFAELHGESDSETRAKFQEFKKAFNLIPDPGDFEDFPNAAPVQLDANGKPMPRRRRFTNRSRNSDGDLIGRSRKPQARDGFSSRSRDSVEAMGFGNGNAVAMRAAERYEARVRSHQLEIGTLVLDTVTRGM